MFTDLDALIDHNWIIVAYSLAPVKKFARAQGWNYACLVNKSHPYGKKPQANEFARAKITKSTCVDFVRGWGVGKEFQM